jgi:WD repeat-containing protein 61
VWRALAIGVAAAASGGALVSCSSDSTVKVWDLGQRSCVQTMTDQSDAVWGVCFNPDATRVASVSDDKSVTLYDFV